MRGTVLFTIVLLLCLTGFAVASPSTGPSEEAQARAAYDELIAAKKWQEGAAARDKLLKLHRAALPVLIEATNNENKLAREYAYEALRRNFPTDPAAVEAFLHGLSDSDDYDIVYPTAFHLGSFKIESAAKPLRELMNNAKVNELTRLTAAKSLAEIGAKDKDVAIKLFWALWADDFYSRYVGGIGIKALTGKDLTDFGYKGAMEDVDMVSGPAVYTAQGQFIRKAEARANRYQAIVAFAKWWKSEKPELVPEIKELW